MAAFAGSKWEFLMDIDEKHRNLAHLLLSLGWNDVFKPVALQRIKTLYDRLLDPQGSRKDKLPDDFVRGQIAALRWALEWPEKEMAIVAQALREREEDEAVNLQRGATPH